MKNYTASLDGWTRFYTIIYVIFTMAILLFMARSNAPGVSILVLSIILLGAFLVSFLMVPKISVENKEITIKNTFTKISIPVQNIKIIKPNHRIGLNFRSFGVGGIFGFFGYFNWREVWYVTNIYKKVKIVMKTGKVYMISVENPEEFVPEIKKLMQF